MEFMQNMLYSKRLKMMFVWFPKCMCTTMRDVFLRIHIILNPYIVNEPVVLDIHQIHCRKRFRYISATDTPLEHVIVMVRNPFHRMVSTFFDKHVMKRQWHYLNLHNYRKFRVWLDVHNLPHTFVQYVRFVMEHHFLDIHDMPIAYQMPLSVLADPLLGSCRFHIFSMEDSHWTESFITLVKRIMKGQHDTASRRVIEEVEHMLRERLREKRNSLPRRQNQGGNILPDMVFQNTTWWNEKSRDGGGFPQTNEFLKSLPPKIMETLNILYRDDTCLIKYLRQNHGRLHAKISWPEPCANNIWLNPYK